jgi:hypothetical protein
MLTPLTAKQKRRLDGSMPAARDARLGTRLGEIEDKVGSFTATFETPVNSVAAGGTLTISGAAKDGETVTIGSDVYELAADEAQTVGEGHIAVDITEYAAAAKGTLTVAAQPTAGDKMTIGEKEYVFVPAGTNTADGEIAIGDELAETQANIVAAINGEDDVNTPHPLVSIADFASNDAVITALVGGTAGNNIATTETFTSASNEFDGVKLGTTQAGADCTAANAVTALVAAIIASDTQGVGAADGTGDTVVLTADVKGTSGNAIGISTTMEYGSFGEGKTKLEGGVDGTVGTKGEIRVDDSYIYVCTAANGIHDANWERAAISSF